ncbi:putative mitochondrial mitochondrial RNA binding complex 1 subunit (MRB10130) [Leptomonas pyrrhocoris]|uniref:Putative mitochondrial mitochondrial RNA binding complex 1 subunit (MRB10130) n=1 Tax=Leptomonas pyrrhocoris TaxID=157538 RepID=A0A0N0DWB3_LEPPY|nr:putative mitochondrial mitochondrial RNA binding complex 1 subunit (MRB10130) [Leptomonas pyrrhocoris]KPA81542.1 putative mitochondrial mitochondrial RNA binding complex 1 subunit (MRB10130) [Leptomonas pyrrhocoris]|eukprot:XP_015659981.1 putative mitochondrial mitochondrial RNA binding complex 1 subunit (MRB10130) [Leptomonas pyrrhocoris]
MNRASGAMVAANLFQSAVSTGSQRASLQYIFHRIRLNLVPFNAQDVYQICLVAYNSDTIDLMADAEVMRGVADSFNRADQSVLTPFQASLVVDTLRKAGINASSKEVMVPEEDAVSPETLLDVLRAMNVHGGTRDEKKIAAVLEKVPRLLDEFSPSQLALALSELGKLRCSDADAMHKIAKRLFNFADDVGPLEASLVAKSLAMTRGTPYTTLRRAFSLAEQRISDFQPEDYTNTLVALQNAGRQYTRTFTKLVEAGLEHVENMDATTLTAFLVTFTQLEYTNREHVEIFADAFVDVANDLDEKTLVQAFVALQRLNLLHEDVFSSLVSCLLRYAALLDPRHLAPVMDVCSSAAHNSDVLMKILLDRAFECTRYLHPAALAEILDIVAHYPPAHTHPLVDVFGRQAQLRLEIFSSLDLARATRGLAHLGYRNPEYYTQAAQKGFMYGFKDWSFLEPILMGMSYSEEVPIRTIKVLASFTAPMAKSMSLQEVERANRYFLQMKCEEDFVYRALANRVMHFVKEITPDMPQELQQLVQRGAVNRMSEV